MKILNIGIARGLFDSNSASYKWAIQQSEEVDEISSIVFTLKKQGFIESHTDKYHLYPTNSKTKFHYYIDTYRLAKKIISNKKDLVVSAQDPIESGVISCVISRYFNLPFHVQLHFDIFNKYWVKESLFNFFKKHLSIYILKRADHVRVVAEFLKEKIIGLGISEDRITNVPVFVDLEDYKKNTESHKNEFGENSFIFVSVGRFTYQKNYISLIRVFSRILEVEPRSILVLVGKGELLDEIKNEIARFSLEDKVRIVEWTNSVASWYKTADVYLQPSLYEGWGMCVIEAMASSVPVIMSQTGCADEIVVDNKSGLVVLLDDEVSLYDAMKKMLENKDLKERLVVGGLKMLDMLPTKNDSIGLYKKGWSSAIEKYNN